MTLHMLTSMSLPVQLRQQHAAHLAIVVSSDYNQSIFSDQDGTEGPDDEGYSTHDICLCRGFMKDGGKDIQRDISAHNHWVK